MFDDVERVEPELTILNLPRVHLAVPVGPTSASDDALRRNQTCIVA
jgi:hypothetical protein